MSRLINRTKFGSAAGKIEVEFHDGSSTEDGHIVRQKGVKEFIVSDGTTTVAARLAETQALADSLTAGLFTITASRRSGLNAVLVPRFRITSTIVVADGGTGYEVGDIITVVGGTGTAAVLTVATVNEGAVLTLTVTTSGLYSAFPGTAGTGVRTVTSTTTDGDGEGVELDLQFELASIAITSGGSEFKAGEALVFSSGDFEATIDTVDGAGAITAFDITDRGAGAVAVPTISFDPYDISIKRLFARRCVDMSDRVWTWATTGTPSANKVVLNTISA